MPATSRAVVDPTFFNLEAELPYELRLKDFELAIQDVYDLLFDVNSILIERGLDRFDDMLRKQAMSGVISDALTTSLAKHSRALAANRFHNGHPDLVLRGRHENNAVKAGDEGVEIKTTRGKGAPDAHGAREAWLCVFYYVVDDETEPASTREPMTFRKILLARLEVADFRTNERGALGTRTSSPDANGMKKLRANWIYDTGI